jgi:hypothetical protein
MITSIGKVSAMCCTNRYASRLGAAENHDPFDPDASPDYDSWGFDTWWTASEWVTWHKSMKSRYGLDEANRRFIKAWQDQGILSGPIDARSFDTSFREYAKANGFFDGLYWNLGVFTRPIGVSTDLTVGITRGISTVAELSRYTIPVVVLGFLSLYVWSKSPKRRH